MRSSFILQSFLTIASSFSIVSESRTTKIEYSPWLKTFDYVVNNVIHTYPECFSMDITVESTSIPFFMPDIITTLKRQDNRECDKNTEQNYSCSDNLLNTVLITNLNISPNNDSNLHEYKRKYTSKFRFPCSLVLYHLDALLLNVSAMPEVGEWPDGIAVLTPSPMERAFFVFYTYQTDLMQDIVEFSNFTQMILHSSFVIPDEEQLNIFRNFPQTERRLLLVQSYKYQENGVSQAVSSSQNAVLFPELLNFNGEPLLAMTCFTCTPNKTLYERKGVWSGPMWGALYSALIRFNASLATDEVFGIPGNGFRDDGTVDDFVLPVVDRTAVFATTTLMSDAVSKFMYVPYPFIFDGLYFITGLPKRKKANSFVALQTPLDETVWLAVVVTTISLLLCLRFIAYVRHYRAPVVTLVYAIVLPMVEQPPLSSYSKFQMAKVDGCVKLIVATWFLSQIVLVCVYKSILLSVIVIPQYKVPPRTFEELAHSNYELGAIFYSNMLEFYLEASNSSVSRTLIERIREYEYIAPTCYSMVLDGPKACLGYSSALQTIGGRFTRDVQGRPLTMFSKESRYATMACVGVSKYYPMFKDPLDWYSKLHAAADLNKWQRAYSSAKERVLGQKFAIDKVENRPVYSGVHYDEDDASDAKRIVQLVVQILAMGLWVSFCIFGLELSRKYLKIICSYSCYASAVDVEVDLPEAVSITPKVRSAHGSP